MINVPANEGQDWEERMAQARTQILDKLRRLLGKDIGPLIRSERIQDPRGIETDTLAYQGAIYGASANSKLAVFARHPNFSRAIKGLYLCGGTVILAGVFPCVYFLLKLCLNLWHVMTLSKLLKRTRSTGLLLVFYSVGVLGLCAPYQQQVLTLTPFILLATAGLLFAHHKPWRWSLAGFCGAAWAISFLVEVVGVHTGWVFGPYRYGAHLGWQLWGVPVLIGLNWVVLVYAAGNMVSPLVVSRHTKCLVGALLVVLVDWLMEPVAVRLGFWQWTGGGIPAKNYVAWYMLACGLLGLFYQLGKHPVNPMAPVVYAVLLAFWGILGLLLV